MRHSLKDRANVAVAPAVRRRTARHRKARTPTQRVGTASDTHRSPLRGPRQRDFYSASELDELLGPEDEAAAWWQEEAPFDEILQQLTELGDFTAPAGNGASQTETRADKMAAAASTNMAATSPPRGRCPGNKNALAARLNRLRKKEYVRDLETRVTRLSEENQDLQRERKELSGRVRELEGEARYLRAVLANDSALSRLLGHLTGLGGTRLSTSLFQDPQSGSTDHDYALPRASPSREEEEEAGGVCLHVDKNKLSVEFCATCSRKASSADKM